jgi:hypothetical protein
MKKLTSLFCLCAVSLAQMGTAMADDSGTTEASNYLMLSGAVSESQYVLTVSLENTAQVRDMMFDITVPTGLSVSNVATNFSNATSYTLASNEAKSRVILYSTESAVFDAGFNSPVLNITLGKEDDATFEGQTITLSGVQLSASTDNGTSLVQTVDNASWTIPASYADVSGTVYAGASEAQTKTLTEFVGIREVSPNAIMIVDGASADLVGDVKNVVYEYTNDGVKTYVCRDFELTDLKDFYSPVDFVAKSVLYTRTVGETVYNSTCCLPFAFATTNLPDGYEILTFSYFERITDTTLDDQGYVYFSKNTSVKAGVPCFLYSTTPSNWSIELENATVVSTPMNSSGLKGAFAVTDLTDYQPCYRPTKNNDKLTKASAPIQPFRSVLSLKYDERYNGGYNNGDEAPERVKMRIIGGDTDGIETINMDKDETVIYNINGQKVLNDDKAGFYIINGKKVIKK